MNGLFAVLALVALFAVAGRLLNGFKRGGCR